jgi:hypothetical protein
MKPILDWTKSKAEAYTPGAAPKGTFPAPFSFAFSKGLTQQRESTLVRLALIESIQSIGEQFSI